MPKRPGPKSKTSSFLGDEDVSDAESFQSAGSPTDDGFDYTNDNPSTSRQATARVTKGTTQQQKRQSQKGGKQQTSQKPGTSTKQKFLSARNKSPSSRRKQTNPLRRDKLMWKQIKELQRRTDNLTPKASFGRLIRELLIKESSEADRITKAALECLQTSAELYLTQLFSDAYALTLHRDRVTLGINDIRLVLFLRGPADVARFRSV